MYKFYNMIIVLKKHLNVLGFSSSRFLPKHKIILSDFQNVSGYNIQFLTIAVDSYELCREYFNDIDEYNKSNDHVTNKIYDERESILNESEYFKINNECYINIQTLNKFAIIEKAEFNNLVGIALVIQLKGLVKVSLLNRLVFFIALDESDLVIDELLDKLKALQAV